MAHTFGDLEETIDGLHRSLAAGVSSASHWSQVRVSQWHGLGNPKYHMGKGQDSHRKEGETFLRGISSKPNNLFFIIIVIVFNVYIPAAFKCEHSSGVFNTHTEQSSTGAGGKEKQPRHQSKQEGLLPQDQQILLRPQNGSVLDRGR